MFAEQRSCTNDVGGVLLEDVGDANAFHFAEDLVFPLYDVFASCELRIFVDVLRSVSSLAGDACAFEDFFQFLSGTCQAEFFKQLFCLCAARIEQGEAGAFGRNVAFANLAHADDGEATFYGALTYDRYEDSAAVLGVIEGEASGHIVLVAGTQLNGFAVLGHFLVEPYGGVVVQQTEHVVVLSYVSGVAFAPLQSVDVTCQSADASVVSGYVVGQVGVNLQGAGFGRYTVHVHVAAHCLTGNVVRSLVLVGAELTVAGNVNDRQLGVDGPAEFVGQAALVVAAGTTSFDPNVCPCDCLLEQFLAALGSGVQSDGVFVSVQLCASGGTTSGASDVGSFCTQNLCAHFSHQRACEGTCDVGSGNEYLNALQNTKLRIVCKGLRQRVVKNFHL